jgi:hypothetical protein
MFGCLKFGLCFLTRWQLCHKTSDGTAVRCLADVERQQQQRIVKDYERRSPAARCVSRGGTVASEVT